MFSKLQHEFFSQSSSNFWFCHIVFTVSLYKKLLPLLLRSISCRALKVSQCTEDTLQMTRANIVEQNAQRQIIAFTKCFARIHRDFTFACTDIANDNRTQAKIKKINSAFEQTQQFRTSLNDVYTYMQGSIKYQLQPETADKKVRYNFRITQDSYQLNFQLLSLSNSFK